MKEKKMKNWVIVRPRKKKRMDHMYFDASNNSIYCITGHQSVKYRGNTFGNAFNYDHFIDCSRYSFDCS